MLRHPIVVVALATLIAVPAFAGLDELADQIDRPTVGPEVRLGEPLRLENGILTPANGTRVFQLLAGGQPVGIYVAGPAQFAYIVRDRYSIPVAQRNLKRATSIEVKGGETGLEVVEPLDGALVWGWHLRPPVSESPAPSPALPEWLGKLFDEPLFERPSLDLLTARRLAVSGVTYGLLAGKHDYLLWSIDPIREVAESLFRIEKTDTNHPVFRGRFYAARLATQPIQRQWWERFPSFLVAEKEVITVENPADDQVIVRTAMDLRSTMDGVGIWRANLASERTFHAKAIPIGVSSVTVEGKPAPYLHRDDQLVVELPRMLAQGETVHVEVVDQGDIAFRPQGDNFWSLGTWAWYPQPNLNGELATVDLSLRVPKSYTPFASGDILARGDDDAYSTVETRLDKPMQFPVVAAGKYQIFSNTKDGITCNVATYASGNERGARRLINNFFAASEFYQHLFGIPYPFKEFTVIERNTWGFGQAPPGIIFITKEAFDSILDETSQAFSRGINERYVHEIAHAWWGHVIKMDSLEEQWLTESFASYSAALCLQAMYGGKRGQQEFKSLMTDWNGSATDLPPGGSIYLANYLAGEGFDVSDRSVLLYRKGPVVLHALRQELARQMGGEKEGDRYFFALLRSFLKNLQFQWGGTRHLVGILEQMTQKPWQPWFDKYVYGTEIPQLEL